MPYKKYLNEISLGNTNEFFNRIKGEVISLIKASEFEFYELELFSVQDILLKEDDLPLKKGTVNVVDFKYYGAIKGHWINNENKKILPMGEQWVLPLDPTIKRYPIKGENVVCVNYLGRTYYTTTLNHNNNPNNSILSGLSSKTNVLEVPPMISTDPKYSKPVLVEPGDISIQGRFNNSINIGSQDMVGSSIKLVAGHFDAHLNDSYFQGRGGGEKRKRGKYGRRLGEALTYDLEKDSASIYIQDGGNVTVKNPNSKLGSNIVTGKKIILDADYIVINAKKQLKLQGGDLVEVVGGNTEIKHNAGGQIATGETEKAIDELRERTKKKLVDAFEDTKKEFIDAKNLGQTAFDKGIKDLKDLDDKMKDAVKDIEKKIKQIRQVSFTFDAQEFTKLQDKVNKLQAELGSTPPTDPVRITRLGIELIDVFRSFVTLDFMNKDIVTIKKKK